MRTWLGLVPHWWRHFPLLHFGKNALLGFELTALTWYKFAIMAELIKLTIIMQFCCCQNLSYILGMKMTCNPFVLWYQKFLFRPLISILGLILVLCILENEADCDYHIFSGWPCFCCMYQFWWKFWTLTCRIRKEASGIWHFFSLVWSIHLSSPNLTLFNGSHLSSS